MWFPHNLRTRSCLYPGFDSLGYKTQAGDTSASTRSLRAGRHITQLGHNGDIPLLWRSPLGLGDTSYEVRRHHLHPLPVSLTGRTIGTLDTTYTHDHSSITHLPTPIHRHLYSNNSATSPFLEHDAPISKSRFLTRTGLTPDGDGPFTSAV